MENMKGCICVFVCVCERERERGRERERERERERARKLLPPIENKIKKKKLPRLGWS